MELRGGLLPAHRGVLGGPHGEDLAWVEGRFWVAFAHVKAEDLLRHLKDVRYAIRFLSLHTHTHLHI